MFILLVFPRETPVAACSLGNGAGTSAGIQKVTRTTTRPGGNPLTHGFKICGLVRVFAHTLAGDRIPHQIGTLRGRSDTPKGPCQFPKETTGLPIPVLELWGARSRGEEEKVMS
ncbi:hypothetical protein BD779DRAFT_1469133 [Infundibulicybe gibba]|nr:hypothetical protein BD779DRAFT_1469133 [Infundibulicybe gibba]